MVVARGALVVLVALVGASPGCYIKADSSRLFRATHVVVEMGYVLDSSGADTPFAPPWPILGAHLARVFHRANPTLDFRVPVQLTDAPASLLAASFSKDDAFDYAKRKRTVQSTGDTAAFYVLLLPGQFDVNPYLLGLTDVGDAVSLLSFGWMRESLTNAAYWGQDFGLDADASASIVQQLVMTHEIAHAIGLVDSGVSMSEDHGAPGGHCSTTTCLMAPIVPVGTAFLAVAKDPTAIVFDDKCLADIDAMK